MAKFTYVVQDNEGIHARPAGMLAKEAKALEGVKVTIAGNGKTADATRLMAIMAMGIEVGAAAQQHYIRTRNRKRLFAGLVIAGGLYLYKKMKEKENKPYAK